MVDEINPNEVQSKKAAKKLAAKADKAAKVREIKINWEFLKEFLRFFRKPSTNRRKYLRARASMMARITQKANTDSTNWFNRLRLYRREILLMWRNWVKRRAALCGFAEEFTLPVAKASNASLSCVNNPAPFKFSSTSTRTFQNKWWNFLDREWINFIKIA